MLILLWKLENTISNDLEIFTIRRNVFTEMLHKRGSDKKIFLYSPPWIFWVGPVLASQSRYASGLRKCHSWLFKRTVTAPWLDSHCSTALRDISPMHPANLYSYLYNLFPFDNQPLESKVRGSQRVNLL